MSGPASTERLRRGSGKPTDLDPNPPTTRPANSGVVLKPIRALHAPVLPVTADRDRAFVHVSDCYAL